MCVYIYIYTHVHPTHVNMHYTPHDDVIVHSWQLWSRFPILNEARPPATRAEVTENHPMSRCGLMAGWWLSLPLWKIWKSIGIMKFPIYGKITNVPKHQPNGDSKPIQGLLGPFLWNMSSFQNILKDFALVLLMDCGRYHHCTWLTHSLGHRSSIVGCTDTSTTIPLCF